MSDAKSPWEDANERSGSTDSERYLSQLAKRAFLSMWSYANLYTDEGRGSGKGDGKEFCDLVVVFGKAVILFSDKQCEFPKGQEIKVAWSRWYRRAIEKSVKQLVGAERFIRNHPGRLYLDKQCNTPFPFEFPHTVDMEVYLVAVTRGGHEAARAFFGQGSSGSLMISTRIHEGDHYHSPFRIGWPAPRKRFVHVFDEITLDIVLGELDTVPDFLDYLKDKEQFLASPGVIFDVAGEEDLLAVYQMGSEGITPGFTEIPPGVDFCAIQEGLWAEYAGSPQRSEKAQAISGSYLWDTLIEFQCKFIRSGEATSPLGQSNSASEHEEVVRAMANETRLARSQLAGHLHFAISKHVENGFFARVAVSPENQNRAYVFLTMARPPSLSYEEYREQRVCILSTYCDAVKLRRPEIIEMIGIASEPIGTGESSQDFTYSSYPEGPIEGAAKLAIEALMNEFNIFRSESTGGLF